MSKQRSVNTDLDLVAALGDVLENVKGPESEEEIDAVLREAGHDPDAVARGTSAFVDDLVRATIVNTAPINLMLNLHDTKSEGQMREVAKPEGRVCFHCYHESKRKVVLWTCMVCGRQCCTHNCTDKEAHNSCICQTCYLERRRKMSKNCI